jgi:phospholipase/carboxylesterase
MRILFLFPLCFAAFFLTTACSNDAVIDAESQPHYVRKEFGADKSKGSVLILLHGYGSNELDLLGLKQMFPTEGCAISFRAPLTIGRGSFCWFPIQGHDGSPVVDTTAYFAAGSLLNQWIDSVIVKENLQHRKIFLSGFSQGAMMCYEMVRRFPQKFSGIVAFSGSSKALNYLAEPSQCDADILMTHGKADKVLSYESALEAKSKLEKCGASVEFYTFEGGHQISTGAIAKASEWLAKRW